VDGTNLSYTVTIPTGSKLTVSVTAEVVNVSGLSISEAVSLFDGSSELPGSEMYFPAVLTSGYTQFPLQAVIAGDNASHTITMR